MDDQKTPLAKYMADKKLPPKEVAASAGKTVQAVRLWMHGRRLPNANSSRAVRDTIGIPMDVLRPDLFPASNEDTEDRQAA